MNISQNQYHGDDVIDDKCLIIIWIPQTVLNTREFQLETSYAGILYVRNCTHGTYLELDID